MPVGAVWNIFCELVGDVLRTVVNCRQRDHSDFDPRLTNEVTER